MSTHRKKIVLSLPLITYSLLLFFLNKLETVWSVEPDHTKSTTSDRCSGFCVDVPTELSTPPPPPDQGLMSESKEREQFLDQRMRGNRITEPPKKIN